MTACRSGALPATNRTSTHAALDEALDARRAGHRTRRFRRLADRDRRAYVALAWLLVPGASLVADQLWIQMCEHHPADEAYVATTILRRVERESMAELGFGELAKRRDPTWASLVLIERYDETIPTEEPDAEEPREQLIELLRRALDSGALSDQDRGLLLDLSLAANLADAHLRVAGLG